MKPLKEPIIARNIDGMENKLGKMTHFVDLDLTDFVPEEDNDNDNMMMLPNDLFINLIDTDLQRRIAHCDTLDKDATNALALLLEQGPSSVKHQLDDWSMETFDGKTILFFKGKNYIPQDEHLR